MSCCSEVHLGVAGHHAEMVEDLKVGVAGFGVTADEIADLIGKYGDTVLGTVMEALRSGFSKAWVFEALVSFGPVLLSWVLSLFNRRKMAMGAGGLVVGEEVKMLEAGVFQDLLEKYLPMIVEKYGPQLIDLLVQYILKSLK